MSAKIFEKIFTINNHIYWTRLSIQTIKIIHAHLHKTANTFLSIKSGIKHGCSFLQLLFALF